jgi:hypothetical protein
MTVPTVVKCLDGNFCCTVFGLGPYIADYPESGSQALCQTGVQSESRSDLQFGSS